MSNLFRKAIRHLKGIRHARIIRSSGVFDPEWYLSSNPDVAASGINPIRHYLNSGASEGRNPSPLFDTGFYLEQNPDVAASGVNPLLHYVISGRSEGRKPCPTEQPREALLQENAELIEHLHAVQECLEGAVDRLSVLEEEADQLRQAMEKSRIEHEEGTQAMREKYDALLAEQSRAHVEEIAALTEQLDALRDERGRAAQSLGRLKHWLGA